MGAPVIDAAPPAEPILPTPDGRDQPGRLPQPISPAVAGDAATDAWSINAPRNSKFP
jgi:hypothetical protein